MRDAVVVGAFRTPIGKRNGALSTVHPVDLSARVLEAVIARTQVDPAAVDDVIWGCVSQAGEQAGNIARLAVLAADWPESVPGTTVDRACGSSQQAVHFAAAGVIAGHYDLVVAGGVESMSRVPMGSTRRNGPGLPYGPRVRARYKEVVGADQEFNQGVAAEFLAERWNLSRAELDEYALESHRRAAAAIDSGAFDDEIVPVAVTAETSGAGDTVRVDEGVRRDSTLAALGKLRPAFRENGMVSAGNSSQISDGAAAVLITTSDHARALGLTPLVRIHSCVATGVDPVSMLWGPIPATEKVLRRAGISLSDTGVYEVNEAFASVTCGWLKETGADPARLNPRGGAIALGHPLGCSGARLLTTLASQMVAGQHRYGLQAMCEGGGMANAMVLELV